MKKNLPIRIFMKICVASCFWLVLHWGSYVAKVSCKIIADVETRSWPLHFFEQSKIFKCCDIFDEKNSNIILKLLKINVVEIQKPDFLALK